MNYDNVFNKLTDEAKRLGLTAKQVRGLTKQQVANYLNENADDPRWSDGNVGLFTNLRENVARELEREVNQADMIRARNAVLAIFPNATFNLSERGGTVIIKLNGGM